MIDRNYEIVGNLGEDWAARLLRSGGLVCTARYLGHSIVDHTVWSILFIWIDFLCTALLGTGFLSR